MARIATRSVIATMQDRQPEWNVRAICVPRTTSPRPRKAVRCPQAPADFFPAVSGGPPAALPYPTFIKDRQRFVLSLVAQIPTGARRRVVGLRGSWDWIERVRSSALTAMASDHAWVKVDGLRLLWDRRATNRAQGSVDTVTAVVVPRCCCVHLLPPSRFTAKLALQYLHLARP